MSKADIRKHLEAVFGVYLNTEYEDGVFEIATSVSPTDLSPKVAKHFRVDELDVASDYADAKAKSGLNVYVVPSLLFGVDGQRCNQAHFYAGKFVVVDVDENWARTAERR